MGNDKKLENVYDKIAKYGVTKRTLYSALSIFACMILIIVLSLVQARFDPTKIGKISFWVDFALSCGICVFAMIAGQQIGDDISRNNLKGAFRKRLEEYAKVYEELELKKFLASFEDWLDFLRERKTIKKMKDYLYDHGIFQLEVLDLYITELENLKTPWKKDWSNTAFEGKYKDNVTYFTVYTEEQIEAIRYCLGGNIKAAKLSQSFFTNALRHSTKDMWESAAKSEKKKSAYMSTNYLYKIISMLIMSFILTGLSTGLNEGASAASAIATLVSRLFQMIVSMVWGIYIGFELVKIDLDYLIFKHDILKQCIEENEKGIFIPKTLEQKAKEAYEKNKEVENGRDDESREFRSDTPKEANDGRAEEVPA